MKRGHESDEDQELEQQDPPRNKPRLEEGDVLREIHKGLTRNENQQPNQDIQKRLYETQKQYFTVYMEKIMKQVPMGENIVDIVKQIDSGKENSFLCMYTAAKNVIQSQMRVKQIKSLHAVFDMVYGLFWRYMHEKVVTPSLSKMVSTNQLQKAYETYQKFIETGEESEVFELQCLLYCIQEEMEKENPSKIPNPMYSRLNQQMKAMSEYVITLLVSMSVPSTPRVYEDDEKEIEWESAHASNEDDER